ncbi:hypothetical protein C8R45DRAFT_934097 [Mycena sanguinolenta]|nr:hypothetical protein C8R45DRAFT_934097 [Mycena sanguinolenta]
MYLVNGRPATTLHCHSQISRHYARSLGLKFSSAMPNLFVLLTVAMGSARSSPTFYPYSHFPGSIADHLAANLVLGSDWVALCRAAASTGDVVFAPGTYEAAFNSSCMSRGDIVTPSSVSRGCPDAVASPEALTVLSSVGEPVVQGPALRELNETIQYKISPNVDESLSLLEKKAIMNFLVDNSRANVLRNMVARHQDMSARTASKKQRNRKTLDEKDDIIRGFRESTSNSALSRTSARFAANSSLQTSGSETMHHFLATKYITVPTGILDK